MRVVLFDFKFFINIFLKTAPHVIKISRMVVFLIYLPTTSDFIDMTI